MAATIRFRWWKLLAFLLTAAAAFCTVVYLKPYPPDSMALASMHSTTAVKVNEQNGWIEFIPDHPITPSILFYPGGHVDPRSYAPLAAELARAGYPAYIVTMPLHLAIFGVNNAMKVIEAHPEEQFVIGGHSLGGAMAARFAVKHHDLLKGVFLLAAYPDNKSDLFDTGLPVLSLLGTLDGKVDHDKYELSRQYLPQTLTIYETLVGANHSQFGNYGLQNGDYATAISPKKQRLLTVHAIKEWLNVVVDGNDEEHLS